MQGQPSGIPVGPIQGQPPGIPVAVQGEIDQCGLVVDAHLHDAECFTTADLVLPEMSSSGVGEAVVMAGPSNLVGKDPNESVEALLGDRLYGLASLNTTGD